MGNFKVKLFFLCLILSTSFIWCQQTKQFSFRNLTVNEGLSQNSVVSIAQDSIGYIWFATQDGLNRYDGKSFVHYNKQYQDVTRSNYAQLGQLLSDSFGDFWSYSSNETIEKYNYETQLFDSITPIKSGTILHRKDKETLWVGTLQNGLASVNLKTQSVKFLFKEQLKNTSVFEIKTIDNSIFLGTSKGIFKIDDTIISHISFTNNYAVSSIIKRNQQLIFGTYGDGIQIIDLQSNTLSQAHKNFAPNNLNIQDLFLDSKLRLWIATYGEGLYLSDLDNKLLNFKANKEDPFAIHYNDILKIYEDNTGNIWFGSDGTGLSYYDEHLVKFNTLTSKQVPDDISVDVVRSIAVDTHDVIWLGTSGKGLTRIDRKNKSFKTFTTQNSKLSSDRIMSLLIVGDNLWIGHQSNGLQILKSNGEFQFFPELDNRAIWKIYKDANNDIWLCTRTGGLIKYDSTLGIIQIYNSNNSNLPNNIRTLEQGKENTLWVGTDNEGLYKLDSESTKIEKIDKVEDKIKSLYYSDGTLWIGTNGNGIKNINEKTLKVTTYNFEFGLPNKVVYGLLKDENGNLWVSTNKGISRFNPNDQYKHYVENFTIVNGLQAYEFNTGAYFKAPDGEFYFGGIEGVNWFHPKNISYNEVLPKTIISKFEVFGDEQQIKPDLDFKHDNNTMTFTFASLHFSQPDKNFFSYKLENHDEDWSVSTYKNFAHYTNLPPNDYTFKVMSSNYEGIWNKTPVTFSFTINNPWYKTNLAYTIYGLLLILTLYTIYSYFKFKWKLETQVKLEHAEAKRLQQLDDFKTKLYTNISHEFRTPLTLISGPIDKQLANKAIKDSDKKELQLVKQNALRLLGLVNQMMDLSLIDAGQIKLKVQEGNLGIILKQLVSAFQYKANEKQITIISSVDKLENCWFDKDIIEKIGSNLLSNAVKYAPETSEIYLDAKEQNNQLFLSVINQNNQVKADKLGKLFERFYQNNEATDGIGVGLALVKDLVTLSKGTILANTLQDDKIQFNVSLPIHKNAFEIFEIVASKKSKEKEVLILKSYTQKNKQTIVIIEDEQDILDFVSSIFQDHYNIIKLTKATKALDLIRKELPDLVISDIMMPEVDGLELCNQLKKDALTSHIPIILLTAKVTQEQQKEGLETGADAYVTKPFNADILKIRVSKLIETREQLKQRFNEQPILTKALEVTSVEAEFMQRLKDVLDKHLVDPEFTSKAFSKYMLMSRTQLHRKLKAVVGMTTSEFIRSQRLLLARDALKKGTTISETAYLVGFNSVSYFIKCFKNIYKETPSQFLEKKA
ncbi:two-component system sensor histidine kinase/response [Flavobacteriales bacterium ALC-1]|nr:two-component system sensor histidine kinase/response [Flavobacteriales bacterium ALC-1]